MGLAGLDPVVQPDWTHSRGVHSPMPPAKITRLKTSRDHAKAERNALVRGWVAEQDMPDDMRQEWLRRAADDHDPIKNRRPFAMIGTNENKLIVKWLRKNSDTPLVAIDLWMECQDHLGFETQQIEATRDQLADAVGTRPKVVSTIMTELESIGAISRRVEKVPGLRGRGRVVYFMNPLVGTHLPGPQREAAQRTAPLLRIVAKKTCDNVVSICIRTDFDSKQ